MEYQIEGGQLPVVICQLEAGETMITEYKGKRICADCLADIKRSL